MKYHKYYNTLKIYKVYKRIKNTNMHFIPWDTLCNDHTGEIKHESMPIFDVLLPTAGCNGVKEVYDLFAASVVCIKNIN